MTTQTQPFPFEQTLDDLETLVHRMETETLSLEEALHDFERGIALTAACQKALDEAEQKVKMIIESHNASD